MQRHNFRTLLLVAWLSGFCLAEAEALPAEAGREEPFNCQAGLDDWRATWSLDKRSWCCQSHNLGCNATSQEASAADSNEPSEPLVERYGPGHCVSTWKTEASHCIVRTDCAGQDISRYPIALLCVDSAGGKVRHVFGEGSFAPEETFDTLIVCEECKADIGPQGRVGDNKALNATLQAFVREVDEIKQRVMTARIEVHTLNSMVHKVYRSTAYPAPYGPQASDLFDCNAGLQNWHTGWSMDKKCWCCTVTGAGCEPQNMGCVPEVPATFPTEAFDCRAGARNQRLGWSRAKKCWCCSSQGVGCDPTMVCEPEVRVVMPTEPFDCNAGARNHRLGWSREKKCWCCATRGMGCDPAVACQPEPPPQTVPAVLPTEPYGELYDCAAGVQNHELGWSAEKKCWCCSSRGVGCDPTIVCEMEAPTRQAPALPPAEPLDCDASAWSYRLGWSTEKKCRCCTTRGIGCDPTIVCEPEVRVATVPCARSSLKFDCRAGLRNYELGWSRKKKIWCCRAYGLGCETRNTTRWQEDLFDCDAALPNANEGWSEEKKKWCCSYKNVGCDLDPYDCRWNLHSRETDWTAAKKYWCCEKQSIGCTSDQENYDCSKGLHDPRRLWSREKKQWCCQTNRMGCSWSQVKAVVHRPRARRDRHREVVVSHDAQAHPPSRAVAVRRRAPGHRAAGAAGLAQQSEPALALRRKPAGLVEEAQELSMESEARMQQLERLKQRYKRATLTALAPDAGIRARAAVAAEETLRADEAGIPGTWSGPGETEDERAAQQAWERVQARSAASKAAMSSPQWRQPLEQLGGDEQERRRSGLRKVALSEEAARARAGLSDGEQLDFQSSAAALVESYISEANVGVGAAVASDRARRHAESASAEAQGAGDSAEANEMWWDGDMEDSLNIKPAEAEGSGADEAADEASQAANGMWQP